MFEDAADAADLFALQKYGVIYSRIANPTVAVFEERVASLEGGIGAVAAASGQSAEFLTIAALCRSGDHVVSSAQLYGGTRTLLEVTLARFGIVTTFVPGTDPAVRRCDRPANPVRLHRADRQSVRCCRRPGGSGRRRPRGRDPTDRRLDDGHAVPVPADGVGRRHRASLGDEVPGGHGTSLGGVVVESGRFDWGNGNFPAMIEPVASYGGLSWWGNFGEYGFLPRLRAEQLRDVGPALSPFNAFLLLQGVETLPQRMDAHIANTRIVVDFLQRHPAVAWVCWPGTPDHPDHARAQRYLPGGPGAVVSFGVVGGRDAGRRFVESVQLCSHLANIGDVRTLVIHPRRRRPISSSTTTPSSPAVSAQTSCASRSAWRTRMTSAGISTRR